MFTPLLAFIMWMGVEPVARSGGHLPWPVVEWLFTSPVGVLLLAAAGTLVAAPPVLLLQPHMWQRSSLAWTTDVTGVPLDVWTELSRAATAHTRAERWLGRTHRERGMSLALLIFGVLLAAALLAALAGAFAFDQSAIDHARCGAHGCAPLYPAAPAAIASEFATLALYWLAQYWWLRRVEMNSGISLRYGRAVWGGLDYYRYYYIRRPGVTPEAAAAALARFAPGGRAPLVRGFVAYVFAISPVLLLISAAFFLQGWLQLQWIPG